MQVVDLRCPGCGAPHDYSQRTCDYCNRPFVVTSFSSLAGLGPSELRRYAAAYQDSLGQKQDAALSSALGICYLKLGLYEEAREALASAIAENIDNSEAFFYAAVAELSGKRAFVTPLSNIKRSETLLNAAIRIEPRGAYYLFLAYLAHDFYERKFLNHTPSYEVLAAQAEELGVTAADHSLLLEVLNIESLGLAPFPVDEGRQE